MKGIGTTMQPGSGQNVKLEEQGAEVLLMYPPPSPPAGLRSAPVTASPGIDRPSLERKTRTAARSFSRVIDRLNLYCPFVSTQLNLYKSRACPAWAIARIRHLTMKGSWCGNMPVCIVLICTRGSASAGCLCTRDSVTSSSPGLGPCHRLSSQVPSPRPSSRPRPGLRGFSCAMSRGPHSQTLLRCPTPPG